MEKQKKKQIVKAEKIVARQSNPVYLKLEYDESIESKRNLLSPQLSLLNIVKIVQRYSLLRQEELVLKGKLHRAIKELNVKIRRTRDSFPFLGIPREEHVQKVKSKVAMPSSNNMPKEVFDRDLEAELRNISEKLRALG